MTEKIDIENLPNKELIKIADWIKEYPISNEKFNLTRRANLECFRRGI